MEILSRGQLASLINTNGIESKVDKVDGKTATLTVIYNKQKDSFHRVVWGEVVADGKAHIWFNKVAEEVKVAPNGEWLTKAELKAYQESLRMKDEKSYLKGLALMKTKTLENITTLNQHTAEMLVFGGNVLYISIDSTQDEINKAILNTLMDDYSSLMKWNQADYNYNDLVESIKLTSCMKVVHEPLLNLNKIEEIVERNMNFDLIVINQLKVNDETEDIIKDILKQIDKLAQDVNCNVTVGITKLKSNWKLEESFWHMKTNTING